MSARTFLVHGLLAGLLAGVAAFLVAFAVGEPSVERAIAIEETGSAGHHEHDSTAAHTHTHTDGTDDSEAVTVPRTLQKTAGLATGTLAVGVALGGVVGLVAAATVGRLGRLTARQTTALITAIGFTAFALVPFLKYPANPPAVGSADTIDTRTAAYFGFVLVSLLTAALATWLGHRLLPAKGAYVATLAGVGLFVVVMGIAALLFPGVDEAGSFPAGALWSFRLGSLGTLTALWAVLGALLTGFVGRSADLAARAAARRELAASL